MAEKRLIDAKVYCMELYDEMNYPGRSEEFMAAIDVAIADLADAPTVDAVEVVRCRECKHLNVVNRKELYAHCPKTNTVFLPFELDTREHFCSLGERKEGADNG